MSKRIGSLVAAAFAISLLVGCAASVKYAPRVPGIQPGYVEQRLGEDTYQVRIGEAWPKDFADLEKFAMYRAAEVTQSRGHKFFKVLNSSTQVSNYEIVNPAVSTTTGYATSYGAMTTLQATTITSPATKTTVQGGWYTLEFRVLPDADVPGSVPVVEADRVIRDLRYFIDSRR